MRERLLRCLVTGECELVAGITTTCSPSYHAKLELRRQGGRPPAADVYSGADRGRKSLVLRALCLRREECHGRSATEHASGCCSWQMVGAGTAGGGGDADDDEEMGRAAARRRTEPGATQRPTRHANPFPPARASSHGHSHASCCRSRGVTSHGALPVRRLWSLV